MAYQRRRRLNGLRKKDSWIARNLIDEKRNSAYSDFLDLIRLCGGKVIVAILCRDTLNYNLIEAKWKCIEFVTERFQFFLQNHADKNGIIIADFPSNKKEERKLLSDYFQLLENGTEYVKPTNIVMNLLTTGSHLNPGLQLADLVVGITTAMCTSRIDYAQPFWSIVRQNFHCNSNGKVIGCRLKVFPRESAEDIYGTLFPEDFEESEGSEENHEEYIERMRYLYSVLMSEDELDMHFPRPY